MDRRLLILVLMLCAIAFQAIAHNAKIATYTLRDTGTGWFIEMNFAQAGVDAGLLDEYGAEQLEGISEEKYKQLFLSYLQDHFTLKVDGEKVKFETGGILLGSHQTDVKFVLPEIPAQPQHMSVYLPMFENTYNQTNLFRIYRGGETFTKFFLSADNDFSAEMVFTPNGIVEVETINAGFGNRFALISGFVVLISLIWSIVHLMRKRISS